MHEVIEVVPDSALRRQLTSDGDDTLNNIRVPSLERDEDIEKVIFLVKPFNIPSKCTRTLGGPEKILFWSNHFA